MFEFVSRTEVQRSILRVVNNAIAGREPLFGLSKNALDRWVSQNQLDAASGVVSLLRRAAAELSMLANRSQDTITGEYKEHAEAVRILAESIRMECMTR
jgi:hypothetical protein